MAYNVEASTEKLINNAKQKGSITIDEINKLLEDTNFDLEQIDNLYDALESLNIKIVYIMWPQLLNLEIFLDLYQNAITV